MYFKINVPIEYFFALKIYLSLSVLSLSFQQVPTDILYLRGQKIEAYRGNYEQFVKTKGERERNQQREYEAQQAKRAHVQEFIDRFRYNANRASSVQSKIKMLEKL